MIYVVRQWWIGDRKKPRVLVTVATRPHGGCPEWDYGRDTEDACKIGLRRIQEYKRFDGERIRKGKPRIYDSDTGVIRPLR